MFLWAGRQTPDRRNDRRSIYQRFREFEFLDRRKRVTALRAGEDRAILLGLSLVFFSIMMYFIVGITILRQSTTGDITLMTSPINTTHHINTGDINH
uniref:KCNMB2 ball/chain domain-containing protein n=1 Tax=Cynoglossus semilaevis TaxID=244447 RepID=A0A3P8UKP6_CYNSE